MRDHWKGGACLKQSRLSSPDFARAYREAGSILAERGNRLMLIEAIIVLLTEVSLYIMLHNVFFTALEAWIFGENQPVSVALHVLYGVLVSALVLFVTLPSLVGLFFLAGNMERGREVVLADLFSPFSSAKQYGRALRLSWGIFLRLGLTAAAVALTCGAALYWFAGNVLAGIVCGFLVLGEICLGLFWCARTFPLMAVAVYDETPIGQAREIARSMTRMCRGGTVFFFGWIPWILLGILTVGILLLWDTLPRMTVAYFRYCRQMNDMIIRSEE